MGFGSRLPNPNEPPPRITEGKRVPLVDLPLGVPLVEDWGPNEIVDEVALLLTGMGQHCAECRNAVRKNYLQEVDGDMLCPVCVVARQRLASGAALRCSVCQRIVDTIKMVAISEDKQLCLPCSKEHIPPAI